MSSVRKTGGGGNCFRFPLARGPFKCTAPARVREKTAMHEGDVWPFARVFLLSCAAAAATVAGRKSCNKKGGKRGGEGRKMGLLFIPLERRPFIVRFSSFLPPSLPSPGKAGTYFFLSTALLAWGFWMENILSSATFFPSLLLFLAMRHSAAAAAAVFLFLIAAVERQKDRGGNGIYHVLLSPSPPPPLFFSLRSQRKTLFTAQRPQKEKTKGRRKEREGDRSELGPFKFGKTVKGGREGRRRGFFLFLTGPLRGEGRESGGVGKERLFGLLLLLLSGGCCQ